MKAKKDILFGLGFVTVFAVFTWLVQTVDVKPLGVNGTDIGFSTLNCAFHKLCGVHMALYTITDWLGLVPIFTAGSFGILGLLQLVKRRSLGKVDADILLLGGYYIVVVTLYVVFDQIPINYRPILIEGMMEVSYPSSTTLLVLAVMPTLPEQISRRCQSDRIRAITRVITGCYSLFMVVGRLISGVHWLTDILGAVFLSMGLFYLYKGLVFTFSKEE